MYKVMIVDDESVIRQGLQSFVDWKALECELVYMATNGKEAKEYLQSAPIDIVITDIKMAGMDGIELAKYIYENHPQTKVILLTAYADFAYAQSAIKYNVVDFLVKINPTEKIPDAVHKAKALIALQQKHLSEIRDKFIKEVFDNMISHPEAIVNKMNEHGISLDNYLLVMFEINNLPDDPIETTSKDYNNFVYQVKHFSTLAFKNFRHYTSIISKNQLVSIVSFANEKTSEYMQLIPNTSKDILKMVANFMSFAVHVGISLPHTSPFELPEAFGEVKKALTNSLYHDIPISFFNPSDPMPSGLKPLQTHTYIDEIMTNIQKENVVEATTQLSKLFDAYKENNVPMEQIKAGGLLLCSMSYKLIDEPQWEESTFINNETLTYAQIQNSKSVRDLFLLLSTFIHSTIHMINSQGNQSNYLVREVNKFIREHYNNQINLQSIAESVHVNSSYLSRLYKKETGEALTDALNKYRIEMAKKLLKNSSLKIFEVAREVGIEDPAYFTHVFTKYAGVSPRAFKEKIF
ncbi:response regulator [Paenibacillus qinlingensis]|uniref:response regulator n=2 Tax=Paenibacillus qinlingensis TaxID=1837343 RepID=UPI00156645B2|nr:response regulator [Paenibacillus qinlingensis]NQX62528.1 response regulator [Paenibacillus qinlingensis]